ncbi:zinc finger CCCH domain-containing protein 7B [Bombina bombina]|uniref:zinc finger CCCH domain-containing protein 7B n=1 Tax=Bombina bombina TaxID=8345 RepID=UPI00235B2FA9|nr:zinc finger CCCH domain-containing protein 7B [Bombina bombina]
MARQKRIEDIEKGLQFIQSTIPFHGSQTDYENFLQDLVRNLFAEGNDLYRDGNPKLALGQYTEGLTVAEYAASEDLIINQELLCKLYVNRSCCYYSMRLFEKTLEDCDKALGLDKDNMRALYRKAKTLEQLGKYQDAYDCISHRLLALVQDENVTELAQELVQKLGLKQRKAYKRPQQELEAIGIISNGTSTSGGSQASSNSLGTLDDIESDLPQDPRLFPSSPGSDCLSDGLGTALSPTPVGYPMAANNLNDFDCEILDDELDTLLDSKMLQTNIAASTVPQLIPVFPTGAPLLVPLSVSGLPAPSPLPPASFGLDSRMLSGHPPKPAYKPLVLAEPRLDTLDSFESSLDLIDHNLSELSSTVAPKHKMGTNNLLTHKPDVHTGAPQMAVPNNPLAQTYDFKLACPQCYVRTGVKVLDFAHKERVEHNCKGVFLLARMKNSENKTWLRIRQRPMKVNFTGPYILCKDIQSRQDCKYGEHCTFAYYQEEIDVWNEERKGRLHRDQLFQSQGVVKPGSIAQLLQEQKGFFTFLCQLCFDSKPRVISMRSQEKPNVCTNASAQHSFPDNKCLVHVLNASTVRYCKIRHNHARFQMDICRHEVRYGCLQEDTCNFAHSHVELSVWMLQRQSGISHEDIVKESEKIWKVFEPKSKASKSLSHQSQPKSLDMKMKFVCGQCLHNGREIEADKDGKYCTAKARHSWTKDKRVLLAMSKAKKKWVPIRPLPSIRNFPQQYDICVHVQNKKKCQYIGNCTFAHSTEEKDVWTFMKENKVLDLQQVFELSQKNNVQETAGKGAAAPQKETDKQILMPTDYADLLDCLHCYLCGKNSNSERQWQKHIQSEKHKERVFTSESEDSTWKFRFPAGEFQLCDSFKESQSCPHEDNCPFAHSQEELDEWLERRELLRQKVFKARKDMLLEPTDTDFGKYSFLLKDIV